MMAARETARTVMLPGGREARLVVADDAGEFRLEVSEYLIAHLQDTGTLTPRQCDAARYLAELYGKSGGLRPWAKGSGGGREPCPDARREFDDLLRATPRRCHWPLTVLAMGEWMTERDPRPLWREGLDAVADRLKMPRVEGDDG